jgi:putative ABC transport system substrate-binding protein
MIARRDFITLLGGAAAALPPAARAQRPGVPILGVLGSQSRELWAGRLRAFQGGLREAGYVEGRNLAIEYRFVDDDRKDLPALAADLISRRVTAIAAFGGPAPAQAAQAQTRTIPIVFTLSGDPIDGGLVASLAHPGGNLTGSTTLNIDVAAKRLELLHEFLPTASTFALLINRAGTAQEVQSKEMETAARSLGVALEVFHAGTEREIDDAFAAMHRPAGPVIEVDSFLISRSDKLAALSLRDRIPAVFLYREFAEAGGLMSYGGSLAEGYRLSGVYAGRILKGERPSDLPVQQATKVELVINLKTAKALGITVPITLLGRADEVIE